MYLLIIRSGSLDDSLLLLIIILSIEFCNIIKPCVSVNGAFSINSALSLSSCVYGLYWIVNNLSILSQFTLRV